MAIAQESDVRRLTEQYGDRVRAFSWMACFHNALKTMMTVFIGSHGKILPRVWDVEFTEMGANHHAYLEIDGMVFNKGITWYDDKYPNLDTDQLYLRGRDLTKIMLCSTLEEYADLKAAEERLGLQEAMVFVPYSEELKEGCLAIALHMAAGASLEESLQKLGIT